MYDTQDVSHVTTSIPADFWADMQWFNTPVERHATFVQPACPRGGLLGGAPEAAPKMSKLQALAAARKKKAQEQKNKEESGVDTPMAGLAISESTRASKITTSPPMTSSSASAAPEDRSASRTYPVRKRKSSSPHKKTSQPAEPIEVDADVIAQPGLPVPEVEQAAPSAFANTMFSKPTSAAKKPTGALFSLPYLLQPNMQSTDAFTGPSPDDIVIAAQSKGSALSAKAKN
jgi:elongation factor 1 alpha-like protein